MLTHASVSGSCIFTLELGYSAPLDTVLQKVAYPSNFVCRTVIVKIKLLLLWLTVVYLLWA